MQSGFTGGGGGSSSNFYTAGRSMPNTMTNPPQQNAFRSQQLPSLFLSDQYPSTHQIARQTLPPPTTTLIGKRTLADFQIHNQNPSLNNLLLRSVKPRIFHHASPISPLSPIDFSSTMSFPNAATLHQQFRSQPMSNSMVSQMGMDQNQVLVQESEKKMMNHRLQELEKQLLDDNEEDVCDAVSVITTTNSEWSETIQSLISPSPTQAQKPISPSSTTSTSSSSSSSSSPSVASPASGCWKQSLMEAASAISEGKLELLNEILTRVTQFSNPKGNSEQRLIDHMLSALQSRKNPIENPPPISELYSLEHAESTQLLYDISACFKLGLMAANLAILEAMVQDDDDDKTSCKIFHVVDFDVGHGGQYKNFLHALSARKKGTPATLKLTTIVAENGSSEEDRLKKVGELLSQLADRVGVGFKFNIVSNNKFGELTRDLLSCDPDEPLAVNFAFKLHKMPDESVSTENPRDELLRRVKGLSPRVVTLVEQEMNTNTAPFTTRVAETCAYYGVLFHSIDSTVSRDNSDRVKVEEALSRKLVNSVACEGRDRVERCEVFGKWRARMGMAGFEMKPLSQKVAESMKTRLSSGIRVNPGFTVKEENGGVCFGWMGRTLTVASAWR